MKRAILSLIAILIFGLAANAQTTEFTYQGNLKDGANPANASYDFEFRLFAVDTGGTALGTLQKLAVPVANGSFSVKLDFGAQFSGATRYLELAVKPIGGGSFTTLTPRQLISNTPYSVRSLNAANADSATNAATATNALQLGGVAANQYLLTNGSGSGLTGLNAGNISTGTLAIANGGTGSTAKNFVDLSTDQTSIGGNKTFTGNVTMNGNLGLGTPAPASKLHVFGNGGLRITADSDSNAGVGLRLNNAPKWSVATVSPGQFQIFNDAIGQNAVWIDPANNNVGIGTNNPAGRFHINVPGSSTPISALTLDVGTFGTGTNAVNSYYFKVRDVGAGTTPAFLIRGDGNVGINTATPTARLDINGSLALNGAVSLSGNQGQAGQVITSNGASAAQWKSPINLLYQGTTMSIDSGLITPPDNTPTPIPGLSQTIVVSGNAKLLVQYTVHAFTGQCVGCTPASAYLDLMLDGGLANRMTHALITGFVPTDALMSGSWLLSVGSGTHTVEMRGFSIGPSVGFGCGSCTIHSSLIVQVIPE